MKRYYELKNGEFLEVTMEGGSTYLKRLPGRISTRVPRYGHLVEVTFEWSPSGAGRLLKGVMLPHERGVPCREVKIGRTLERRARKDCEGEAPCGVSLKVRHKL